MRAILFLLLLWLALVVTAALRALVPVGGVVPEVGLLFVLYLGLRGRGGLAGAVGWALAAGYLVDLFAVAPRGLNALAYGIVMLLARGASDRLLVGRVWQRAVVAFVVALLHGLLLVGLATPPGGETLGRLRIVPWSALGTALLSPLVFSLLGALDRRLWPERVRLGLEG
jgi:rod shape-determining protein MreD